MQYRSVRARSDEDVDGLPVVSLEMGNLGRPPIAYAAEHWVEMSPSMARHVAQQLLEAAETVDRQLRLISVST